MKKLSKKLVIVVGLGGVILGIPMLLSSCGVPFCVAGIGQCTVSGATTGTGTGMQIGQNPNYNSSAGGAGIQANGTTVLTVTGGTTTPYKWYCPCIVGVGTTCPGTTLATPSAPCPNNTAAGGLTITDATNQTTASYTAPASIATPASVTVFVQDSSAVPVSTTTTISLAATTH